MFVEGSEASAKGENVTQQTTGLFDVSEFDTTRKAIKGDTRTLTEEEWAVIDARAAREGYVAGWVGEAA